jgi:RND family efflux transporter MFP subunit
VVAVVMVMLTLTFRGRRGASAIPVEAQAVSRGALEERISGTGSFVPEESATVYARVSGSITSVRANEGSLVTTGDVLLLIDDTDYRLAVNQAQVALESARRSVRQALVSLRAGYRGAASALAQARRAYEKNQELYASDALSEEALTQSREAYENARVNYQSAREQLNLRAGRPLDMEPVMESDEDAVIIAEAPEVVQARLSLQSARLSLERCTVRAPIAGTVTHVMPKEGDLVAPSSPLARVESLDVMLAEVQIDEVDIGKIAPGNAAEITSDSILGQTLTGTVRNVPPTIQSVGSTRVSTVTIGITTTDVPLKAGASCTARIVTEVKDDTLTVPITGFITRSDRVFVYVLQPEEGEQDGSPLYRLERSPIELGISSVSEVEVTSGVEDGDLIAVGNLEVLRDGLLVVVEGDG